MLLIKYIALGIIQGFTEFLPVSSSAHLVIFQEILHIKENQLILNIVLHLGTLCAVIVFLRRDWQHFLEKRVIWCVALTTIFTAAVVIVGKDFFESLFTSSSYVALPLLITGIVLLFTKNFFKGSRTPSNLNSFDAVLVGIVQGLAVIPGISRSGVTISMLLFRKVEPETAFKFSFLISIVAILGALCLEIKGFSSVPVEKVPMMAVAFCVSFGCGLLALKILFSFIQRARMHIFGYYCVILAAVLWIFQAI